MRPLVALRVVYTGGFHERPVESSSLQRLGSLGAPHRRRDHVPGSRQPEAGDVEDAAFGPDAGGPAVALAGAFHRRAAGCTGDAGWAAHASGSGWIHPRHAGGEPPQSDAAAQRVLQRTRLGAALPAPGLPTRTAVVEPR